MAFAINPGLDAGRIQSDFAQRKRLQVHDFLDAGSAEALADHLTASSEWQHVLNAGEKVFEIACSDLSAMAEA